jgi:hypothetical protein
MDAVSEECVLASRDVAANLSQKDHSNSYLKHLELERERSFWAYIFQGVPSAGSVFPAQRAVRRALTAPVIRLWTSFDGLSQSHQIIGTYAVSNVIEGFAARRPSPRFFVDSDSGKTTLRALDNLNCYLIRTAIGG